jgi:exodeoxyribonuclease VII small subunit
MSNDNLLFTPPEPTPPAAEAPVESPKRKRKVKPPYQVPADMKFEPALARLEEIVAAMERGDLSLDDSLRLFEEGTALSRFCDEQLKALSKRVEILTKGEGAEGSWKAMPDSALPEGDEN